MFYKDGPLAQHLVLVNDGVLFIARQDGAVRGGLDGLYFDDERRVESLEVLVNGEPLVPLWSRSTGYRTLDVWAVHATEPASTSTMVHTRYELLSDGLHVVIEPMIGFDTVPAALSARFVEAATDVFVVRGLPAGTVLPQDQLSAEIEPTPHLEVEVVGGVRTRPGEITCQPGVAGHLIVRTGVDRDHLDEPTSRFSCSSRDLDHVWQSSISDLAALRMRDRENRDTRFLAGGAPWYLTLFGRDSLVAGIEASLVAPELLVGALIALAHRQGQEYDDRNGEAPGKILHELRRGSFVRSARGWGTRYYGSVDSTPLFLIALASAYRRGCRADVITGLLPAAQRAAQYLMSSRDVGSDGMLYYRYGATGLANQGWKDSPDAVRFRDGRLPTGDVALVEVQGYVAAALRALAQLLRSLEIEDGADLDARAAHVAGQLQSFWMTDEQTFAQALTRSGDVVDAVTSNPGHLIWAEVLTQAEASRLAVRLVEPDLMSGFGLRTLATTQTGFDPLSYHCGSVWPHDSAMAAVGMLHYDLAEGERLAWDLLESAVALGGRLPEFVVGLSRESSTVALPGPNTCSPQAWASAAPIALLQSLLGLDFDVPNGRLRVQPRLPSEMTIELSDVPVGRGTMSLRVCGRVVEFCNATDLDIDVVQPAAKS